MSHTENICINENICLNLKHIGKKFIGVVALHDVNLNLRKNEILSIVGENGAGKSTLMKILTGNYTHGNYDGIIELDGQPQKFHSVKDSENMGIAMIYQEINVELDLSVAENIFLGIWPKTKLGIIDKKKLMSDAKEILETLEIDLNPEIMVRNLNASMQQIVCIARALVRKPQILVLDEPTSCLTESEAEKLLQIICNLKEKGISSIYISHKMSEVFKISDRICVLRDGKHISTYERADFCKEKIVEDMVGRKIDQMYPKREKQIGDIIFRVKKMTIPHPFATNKNIVQNAGFSLKKGEILGIGGLVGSGRSELVNGIFGAIPKSSGEIYINDEIVHIKSPKEAISLGLGLLTEERKKNGFVGTMNIRENMTLAILQTISNNGVVNSMNEKNLIKDYFNKLRIKAPSLETEILALSGGNQQKVILAKWLLTDIKILILDEPTRGIDVGAKAEIYKLINELANSGVSIIMISSELPELLALSDRILVMSQGRVCSEFSSEEATQEKIMHVAACY